MKTATVFTAFAAIASGLPANCTQTTCPTAQEATSFSLTYGQSLLAYYQLYSAQQETAGAPVVNQLISTTELTTPDDGFVKSPNVDTLYSVVTYDVSHQDLELVVGDVPTERYYSVALYTPYGENYVTFGALTDASAGTYLLTPARAFNTSGTMQTDHTGRYEGIIYVPNTVGVAMVRILVKDANTDIPAVNQIQDGFSAATVNRTGEPIGPYLTDDVFKNSSSSELEYILDLTARFTQMVPRTVGGEIVPVQTTANLLAAGIDPESGTYTKPACVNLTQAGVASQATITAASESNTTHVELGNGWKMYNPGYIGTYGTHYAMRAFFGQNAYLALVDTEALYPFYTEGVFSLGTNESYRMQFAGKPQLEELGFWSVTMYTAAGYLVDNEIDRYIVGDRSNLTYSDGTLVYGSDVNSTFEVLVQGATPPDDYLSNWLPSPANGSDFIMLLRFYAPEEALRIGDYTFPHLELGPAIV
ncbi:hypothetical protein G7054_g3899 [Neopestalotiopsis clavispora]|nr:hypothetical protein G7054_g3899 [Neopestalotiopsis clavispora]